MVKHLRRKAEGKKVVKKRPSRKPRSAAGKRKSKPVDTSRLFNVCDAPLARGNSLKGHLQFSISKREPVEVLMHRAQESRCDGRQILVAMGG